MARQLMVALLQLIVSNYKISGKRTELIVQCAFFSFAMALIKEK